MFNGLGQLGQRNRENYIFVYVVKEKFVSLAPNQQVLKE
jgi:hypothetical protein